MANLIRAARRNSVNARGALRQAARCLCVGSDVPVPVTTLTEEEKLMKETVSRYAREQIQPLVREMDEKSEMGHPLIKSLFENGLMGIQIDPHYGGAGSTFFSSIVAIEELAKVDASVSVVCDVQNTLINDFFISYASPHLQEKYFPRLATDMVGSYCLSEPSCGADAFALRTSAKKEGEYWMLNGQKMWITNAEHAGVFIVMANVDFSKGYKGITSFVVDRDSPGLTVGKKEDKLGIRASSTCPVYLENVKVHESQVIGDVGKGYKYAIETLNTGRIGIAAQMLGLAKGAMESASAYIRDREAFGQKIGSFQAMQHLEAQLATEVEAASILIYNTARMKDHGINFVKEAAMAKYYSSEVACMTIMNTKCCKRPVFKFLINVDVANHVSSRCVEMMGGMGFIKDNPVEKFYRDSKIGQIYEGTSFIQLNTISKCLDEEFKKK